MKKPKNTRDYPKAAHFENGGVAEHAYQRGIRKTQWHKEFKEEHGEAPDLGTPHYNYRKAWREGARPDTRDERDGGRLHWPSKYKGDNHPNRYVDGKDTRED